MTLTETARGLSQEASLDTHSYNKMVCSSFDGLTPVERAAGLTTKDREKHSKFTDPKEIEAALFAVSESVSLHYFFDEEWSDVPFAD